MLLKVLCQRVLIAVLLITAAGNLAAAESPVGAWEMVSYEGQKARGTVSGLLLFTDGHFSLTYAMDTADERIGRAHAGTYDVSGDTLTYHLRWTMEWLTGEPTVGLKTSDRETTFSIDGDVLTISFTNGSVQKFKRAQ